MNLTFLLRQLGRESRGSRGRLAFFAGCLSLGVAAVVAVSGFSLALESSIRERSRELLGADITVAAWRPIPDAVRQWLAAEGLSSIVSREAVTMARPTGDNEISASQVVELRAVDRGYPFYGALETEPPEALAGLDDGSVLVGPDLLDRFGSSLGDSLRLGDRDFRIAGTVQKEPAQPAAVFRLGPRVLMTSGGLDSSGLVAFGSRIRHRLMIQVTRQEDTPGLTAALESLLAADGVGFRVESWEEGRPGLRRGIDRFRDYLGLVALLSLLIGAVGVSQAIRSWLSSRLDAIAVLKCLGVSGRDLLFLHLGQVVLLATIGSLAGVGLGLGLVWALPRMLADSLPVPISSIRVFQPLAILRGVGLGTAVAIGFALPPLLSIPGVPALRVLGHRTAPLPIRRGVQALAALALLSGLLATAWVQSGSPRLALGFCAALILSAAVLAGVALLLLRLLRLVPRSRLGFSARYGLAAVARSESGTTAAIVALGIGILVVVAMMAVQVQLGAELSGELPAAAPSFFLVEIQRGDWVEIQKKLEEVGATDLRSAPVVMARLGQIDGRSVVDLVKELGPDKSWALEREQRLTWAETLPADNVLVAGELWNLPGRLEISLEEEFASDIGAGLGSEIIFDVLGIDLPFVVTSLRRVDWRTFGINFFIVAEPGALDRAPSKILATGRIGRDLESEARVALAESWPGVTLVDIHEVLERVQRILGQLAIGVRLLGLFAVLSGLIILGGSVGAGAIRRRREVALLRTLGASGRQIRIALAAEYGLIGVVASLIGAGGGQVLAFGILKYALEMEPRLDVPVLLLGFLVPVVLVVLVGVLANRRALDAAPLEVLRAEA